MKLKKLLIIFLIIQIFLPKYISNAQTEDNLNIYSEAAILIDSNTGAVLYEKNSNKKMYPASTTKILTAIIIIENCDLNDTTTATKSAISAIPSGYSSCYLSEGETLNIKDLLTVFLVHSANDVGYVLAEYLSGSIENFAKLMNEKAKEIGCTNSNFVNPSGIHDENHYSTAYDMSQIARYCMKNKTFRDIVCLKSCTIDATNKFDKRHYQNTNSLLDPSSKYYIEDCIGIKTGFTSEAQNCLISGFSKDGLELIGVVLGSPTIKEVDSTRYTDSNTLYKYGYENYSLKTIVKENDVVEQIEISNGTKDTRNLDLIVEHDLNALVNLNEEIENPSIVLKENLSAPISQNANLGTISYTINGITYTENLLAKNNVAQNGFALYVLIAIFVGVVSLIFLSTLNIKRKKRKKRKIKYSQNY